jgi:hypothetical protein
MNLNFSNTSYTTNQNISFVSSSFSRYKYTHIVQVLCIINWQPDVKLYFYIKGISAFI